jgi:hypothetical protein
MTTGYVPKYLFANEAVNAQLLSLRGNSRSDNVGDNIGGFFYAGRSCSCFIY